MNFDDFNELIKKNLKNSNITFEKNEINGDLGLKIS